MSFEPKKTIITSIFHTTSGLRFVRDELPKAEVFLVEKEPDGLDGNGMLIPGIGDLDERLKQSQVTGSRKSLGTRSRAKSI
jgi:uracil phosphoribosyltransferase